MIRDSKFCRVSWYTIKVWGFMDVTWLSETCLFRETEPRETDKLGGKQKFDDNINLS